MSYILEALKRADAERERERSAVPSLHAHTDALGFDSERRGRTALGTRLAAGAALLLIGGGALWWWMAAPPPAGDERAAASATPAPVPAAPPAAAVAIAPVVVPASAPVPAPPPPRKAAPAAPPRTAAATAQRPPEPRLPTRNELPSELRAALPPLNVSGAVYAPAPSARLLFIDGLVLHEGDALADGLKVERIGRTSSVLVLRGQRFELKH